MSLNDTLAGVLSQIDNANKVGKTSITTQWSSKLIKQVLAIMKDAGYIGEVTETEDQKGNYLAIQLLGMLNKCGVIKPRFAIKYADFEKFEKRFLPAKGFGFLIVSTNEGLMTHTQAKEKKIGGKLISYCY
ncbi:MAG: 30S ribosomal protein S8 [Nanoarchaeota archaeon]|nr:30S ribosomal protein S8 [Nanoarchaeota archaeon]